MSFLNVVAVGCVAESRWPREETGSTSLPFWCHVRSQSASWYKKKVHHKHSSHWRVYLLIYLMFFSLDMIFFPCFCWMCYWMYEILGKCGCYSSLVIIIFFLTFVYHGGLLECYSITVCSCRWNKQGVLIFVKSKGMLQCHFICPCGIKCCVKCISFSDITKGKNCVSWVKEPQDQLREMSLYFWCVFLCALTE